MGNDTGFAEHSSLGYFFIFVFSMHESIGGGGEGGVLYRSRLFEMHPPRLYLCRYDFSFYPRRFVKIYFVFLFLHTVLDRNKIWILQMGIVNK